MRDSLYGRRRKVRCNEKRPRCSHCERLNLECKWKPSAAHTRRDATATARNLAPDGSPGSQTQQQQPPVNELFNYASFMWDDPMIEALFQPSCPRRDGDAFPTAASASIDPGFVSSPSSLILPNDQLDFRFSPEARNSFTFPGQTERRSPLPCSGSTSENDALIEHFLRSVGPPILAPVETGPKWTSMRALFASMTTASSMVCGAIMAFSALQLKVVDYRPFYAKTDEELSSFFETSTSSPEKVRDQLQYMLATIFLVTYIDVSDILFQIEVPTTHAVYSW